MWKQTTMDKVIDNLERRIAALERAASSPIEDLVLRKLTLRYPGQTSYIHLGVTSDGKPLITIDNGNGSSLSLTTNEKTEFVIQNPKGEQKCLDL